MYQFTTVETYAKLLNNDKRVRFSRNVKCVKKFVIFNKNVLYSLSQNDGSIIMHTNGVSRM